MSSPECCRKINTKSFLITSLIVFIAIALTDFLIHGVLLQSQYKATASLWRAESEMMGLYHWMVIGQAVMAIFFTRIFAHGYQNQGLKEGACFGFMFGGVFAGTNFILYSVAPWPMNLLWMWIATGFVQSIILGVVAAKFYKQN